MDYLTPEVVSVIVGLLVSLATSLVKNPNWTITEKTLVFAGVSVVAAVLQNLGQLTVDDIAQSLVVIVTSAQLFYGLHFHKTKTNAKLEQAFNNK